MAVEYNFKCNFPKNELEMFQSLRKITRISAVFLEEHI